MNRDVLVILIVSAALWTSYDLVRRRLLRAGRWKGETKRIKQRALQYVTRTIGSCPACNAGLNGHAFCEAISIPNPDANVVAETAHAIRNHDWNHMQGRRHFDSEVDVLAYWFIQCPNTGRALLFKVNSRAGFDEKDDVCLVDTLDREATAEFAKVLCPSELTERL